MHPVQGRLVPEGGGDNIDLNRPDLVLGRRPSCDIQMEYPNISGKHLRLCFKMGYWTVEDLGSTNGIKVNGVRVQTRTVYPGDTLTIGKRNFKLLYELPRISAEDDEDLATAAPVTDRPSDTQDGIDLSQSLMEKAGISRRRPAKEAPKPQGFDPAAFLLDE
jgi:adenylate cyclase